VLAVAGGLLGITAGVITARWLTSAFHWPVAFRWDVMILAVGFSGAVGVVFGLYPAQKASQLDPIHALRHERAPSAASSPSGPGDPGEQAERLGLVPQSVALPRVGGNRGLPLTLEGGEEAAGVPGGALSSLGVVPPGRVPGAMGGGEVHRRTRGHPGG